MPRFVILHHDCPTRSHYDLMFEVGDVLKTWSLPQPPEANRESTCQALPDHRPAYLDYEGPLSGDRGSVARWDQGTYETERQTGTTWELELHGIRLIGRVSLIQHADCTAWTLRYAPRAIP